MNWTTDDRHELAYTLAAGVCLAVGVVGYWTAFALWG